MAKTKEKKKSKRSRDKSLGAASKTSSNPFTPSSSKPEPPVAELLEQASSLLHTEALPDQALTLVQSVLTREPTNLQALELAAEVSVELGDIPSAQKYFKKAVEQDPEGKLEEEGGTGPEKFLWLAQVEEKGGVEAVKWYERGVDVLRRWIAKEEGRVGSKAMQERGLKEKLCSALCGLTEIYMTDLCMEEDAEQRCERYVAEALLAMPDNAEALQTLASVRISQSRPDDAKAALDRSLAIWINLEPGSLQIPPYATRIALTRLLVEMEELDKALEVLELLQEEDDQVVDVWYMGGWCLYLLGERERSANPEGLDEDGQVKWKALWEDAREWLGMCMKLYQALEWEDEGIYEHTKELLGNIYNELGEPEEKMEQDEDGEDEEWENVSDEDGDAEMGDS